MQVQYNILIKPTFYNTSPSVQKQCIKATEKFLGEHHVNQFGRVFDGLDKNCDTYYEAEFDFFNRHEKGTLDDAIKHMEKKRLFLGGDEQVEFEEDITFFKKFKNLIEVLDPKIFFYNSWGRYSNDSVPEPLRIDTPLGFQDTHVHILPSLNVLPFYRPTKENCFYDYDLLKGFALDASWLLYDMRDEQRTTTSLIKKYYLIPKQMREVNKIANYQERLMTLEPITKIDIDNNYQLPEITQK